MRFGTWASKASGAMSQRLTALLAELKPATPSSDRLAVKTAGRIVFVPFKEIDWIEAAHNYIEVHAGKEMHMLRQTLDAIEERLPQDKFVRISRSTIVNIDRIKELQPLFHGEYSVTLQNGKQLTLSRRYRDKLKQLGLDP
jgi:two-component system LytT family response regulator